MIKMGTFAEACYDNNSIEELETALKNGADKTDCKEWGITPEEWESSIKEALEELKK